MKPEAASTAVAEEVARQFHHAYESLAPSYGYETRRESAVPWEDVPIGNRLLMTAVAECLLESGVIEPGPYLRLPRRAPEPQ